MGPPFLINALQGGSIASLVLRFANQTDPFTSAALTSQTGFVGFTAGDVTLTNAGVLRLDVGPAAFSDGNQIRIALSNVAAVPEPATWAMLLVGFGAVGYSMRRSPREARLQAV